MFCFCFHADNCGHAQPTAAGHNHENVKATRRLLLYSLLYSNCPGNVSGVFQTGLLCFDFGEGGLERAVGEGLGRGLERGWGRVAEGLAFYA